MIEFFVGSSNEETGKSGETKEKPTPGIQRENIEFIQALPDNNLHLICAPLFPYFISRNSK
jgi:hypothetical protein